ncbi:nitroreductase family protein [Emticicia sp. TH156]|uniref:nitroreductase family protein n=1 Tax=Emticicia sp. TH156 TaxID=2067454 RepID=UPI00117DAE0F
MLPEEIPDDILVIVLEESQLSPSNCNTQLWNVHIVSGQKQQELSHKLIAAEAVRSTVAESV